MTEHQHSSAAARELCQGKSWPDAGAANPRSALGTQLPTQLHTLPGQSSNIAPVPYFGKHAQRTPFMHAVSVAITHLFTLPCFCLISCFFPLAFPQPQLSAALLGRRFSKPLLVLLPNIHIGKILFHKPQNCKSPAVLSPPPSTYICVCRIGCI